MLKYLLAVLTLLGATSCSSSGGFVTSATANPQAIAEPIPRYSALPEQSYVALGDSMTYGYGTADPATQSYPADVGAAILDHVTDLGIDGVNAAQMQSMEVPNVPVSARLVTIMIGVNDEGPIADYQETVWSVVSAIGDSVKAIHAKAPAATIMLLTPIDRSLISPTSPDYPPAAKVALIHSVTEMIDANEKSWRYPVCDVGNDASYYADPADFYTDGYHPSPIGALHIAADVERCLKAL